jgi:hypothetical protein
MTIRLRAHHLLCALTYIGKGYSPAFVVNYDAIAGRLSQGEDVLIVSGPDDICIPLLANDEAHCRRDSVNERDRLAARDLGELLGEAIYVGKMLRLDKALLARMRLAFSAGRIREACAGCEWVELCSTIAASDYDGTLVRPSC